MSRKGLGRGLSALIPDADMEFLSQVARGATVPVPASTAKTGVLSPKRNPGGGAPRQASLEQRASESQDSSASAAEMSSTAADDTERPHILKHATSTAEEVSGSIEWIDIALIEANPFQPRRSFTPSEMEELVSSIREHGMLQPILVRPGTGNNSGIQRYQIVAGERRWRAARTAGLKVVPAIIRAMADQQALELAIVENVQRHDISAIDTALAYQRLHSDFKLSQEDVARRVGKSRSAVANTLRLLDLPEEVRKAIEERVLSEGHGRAILLAPGEGARRALFKRVLRDKLSVREVERFAQDVKYGSKIDESSAEEGRSKNSGEKSEVLLQLEKSLGLRIEMSGSAQKGKISIRFSSTRELQMICDLLQQNYVSRET